MTFQKFFLYLYFKINLKLNNMVKFLKLKDDLFLINQKINKENFEIKTIINNTHHIFIIDCSGSMYDELPKIKKDLYNKITTDLKEEDSLSIIWFSGKNQCGIILEDYHIKSNLGLIKVKDLLDKYLTTVGLTAFKDPFDKAKTIIESLIKNKPNTVHSLFFVTDGYDNQYSTKEILTAVSSIKEKLSSSVVVEYGWYCNKELLSKMACELGGVHIFSEHFQDY